MDIGIIGCGEIGTAIKKVYKDFPNKYNIKTRDIEYSDDLTNCTIINVCFPYSENFLKYMEEYINTYSPKLWIIHSTIQVGTTRKLFNKFPNINIVHSPVRGIHPNLYEGIKTFKKFIGYNHYIAGELANRHFEQLKISCTFCENSDITELIKLLSTTYYGLCIAYWGEADKMMKKIDGDLNILKQWNRTYNIGYNLLNKPDVIRPTLNSPFDYHENGTIGGHCILPNAKILEEFSPSKIFDLLKEYSD